MKRQWHFNDTGYTVCRELFSIQTLKAFKLLYLTQTFLGDIFNLIRLEIYFKSVFISWSRQWIRKEGQDHMVNNTLNFGMMLHTSSWGSCHDILKSSHSMKALDSAFLMKLLTHLVVISSCCLINSKTFDSDLTSRRASRSLVTNNSSLFWPSPYTAHSCNNGLGRLAYEKVADHKLVPHHGSSSSKLLVESISRSGTPFKVLEECQRRCQEDKVTSIGNCASFDFIPGQRRSSPYPKFPSGVSLRVPQQVFSNFDSLTLRCRLKHVSSSVMKRSMSFPRNIIVVHHVYVASYFILSN